MSRRNVLGRSLATCLVVAAIAGTTVAMLSNFTVTGSLTIDVNFDAGEGKTLYPVWNALNIWDPSHIGYYIRDGYT
nr:hypothetical protein [Candidatus Sigynarchaeota archaeon]